MLKGSEGRSSVHTFFLGISPAPGPHLGAVAARLAGWKVLTELAAHVCGTEPSAGGTTGLELKGRHAAVLWRKGQGEETDW
jgi:hypothetical protein